MDYSKLAESKNFKRAVIGVGAVLLALVIFRAGVEAGFRKASFSGHSGEAYYRVFGSGPMTPPGDDLPIGSGASGRIVKIALPRIVIEGASNTEEAVRIASSTLLRRFRDEIAPQDLKIDDFVVLIGSPNSRGEIEARLIRVLPPPPGTATATPAL